MEDKKLLKESIKNKTNENDDAEQKERKFFVYILIIMIFSIILNTIAPLLTVGLIITYNQLYVKNR